MSPFDQNSVEMSSHPNQELPLDPDVLYGVLENGMRYYVRSNARPENRAEIRLVVDAGSILEDDDQQGLAHIVEHMAFNGSKNFGARELVTYFESIGARFGAHLNAQTSFDNTIYKLHVPTDNPSVLEQSFLVLHDWASALLFLPEEIERERKVGLEEWRQYRGAHARLREKLFPFLYYGSRYVERLPIGTEESLQTFSHESLKRFFADWYRPDLMSIVVVGDIDPLAIQEQILTTFSGIVCPDSSRERFQEEIPNHEQTFSLVMSDSELVHRSFSILSKKRRKAYRTQEDLREDLIADLAFRAGNERLSFLGQQKNAPFLGAKIGIDELNRGNSTDVFHAVLPVENTKEAIQRSCVEIVRFQRYGLTAAELNRAKRSHLSALDITYQERDTTHSRVLASEMVRHITEDEVLLGIDFEREFALSQIDTISLAEANAFLAQWLPMENRVQYFITPDAEHPSDEEFFSWVQDTQHMEVEPLFEEEIEQVLLSQKPTPGHVVRKQHIPEIDVEEWVLSNDVKVWIKKTDFQSDRILCASHSAGGKNLIPTEEIYDSKMTTSAVFRGGVGSHSFMELQKMLSGASVRIMPTLMSFYRGFHGVCTGSNLETLFQLHYLLCTEPRYDEDVFQREIEVAHSHTHNRLSDPEHVFFDACQKLYWNDHPRRRPMTHEIIDSIQWERCQAQYERFFGQASAHYVFTGNLDLEQLEEYLSLYVASLPNPVLYMPQDWGERASTQKQEHYLYAGKEPSASYKLMCFVEGSFVRIDRVHLTVLCEYLNLLLRRRLREELGGVYSVHAQEKPEISPVEGCLFTVEFSCDPERVEELRAELITILSNSPKQECVEEDIANIVQQLRLSFETSMQENEGWMMYLTSALEKKEDPRDIAKSDEYLDAISPQSLASYWNVIYDLNRILEVIMLPEDAPRR